MGGLHIDFLLSLRIYPATENAPAWKYQGMRPIAVDDGQFKIAVEGCKIYGLPHIFLVKPSDHGIH
jgi:hypothetical protein